MPVSEHSLKRGCSKEIEPRFDVQWASKYNLFRNKIGHVIKLKHRIVRAQFRSDCRSVPFPRSGHVGAQLELTAFYKLGSAACIGNNLA